jgi:hypothetical protein
MTDDLRADEVGQLKTELLYPSDSWSFPLKWQYPMVHKDAIGVARYWTITLNEYHRTNLIWLLGLVGYPDGHGVEPFTYANTGDWVGEIHNMLRSDFRETPSLGPNCSADDIRARVAAFRTPDAPAANESTTASVPTVTAGETPGATYETREGPAPKQPGEPQRDSAAAPSLADLATMVRDDLPLNDAERARISEIVEGYGRLEIQLAGCGRAALGWSKDPIEVGGYGWSASFVDVLKLRMLAERAASALGCVVPEIGERAEWMAERLKTVKDPLLAEMTARWKRTENERRELESLAGRSRHSLATVTTELVTYKDRLAEMEKSAETYRKDRDVAHERIGVLQVEGLCPAIVACPANA